MSKLEELESLIDMSPKPAGAKVLIKEIDLRRLLAVVRAAQVVEDMSVFITYPEDGRVLGELGQALAALEGEK